MEPWYAGSIDLYGEGWGKGVWAHGAGREAWREPIPGPNNEGEIFPDVHGGVPQSGAGPKDSGTQPLTFQWSHAPLRT